MSDEKQFPEILPEEAQPPETDHRGPTQDMLADEPAESLSTAVEPDENIDNMPEATLADEPAESISIAVEPDEHVDDLAEEKLAKKKPIVIADEEVALTADRPPISAAEIPHGKTDDGYAFRLPQPKFVKRANLDASEKLDTAFEETDETFQMIAGQVDKLAAEIDLTDQAIRSKDWRLEADLTPEKKSAAAQTPAQTPYDKKEAEKRALAEQYKKMEAERRQRDNVHIEKMRAEREALEAKMRTERESRQSKMQSGMEATQERLRAEREAKRAEREAYEAQRKGITPPPAKPAAPPLPAVAKPVPPAKPETLAEKEERALRNLSKPEPEPGENKPE